MISKPAVVVATLLAPFAATAADIPGNSGTKAVLPFSPDYTRGAFETGTDHDWFRISLEKDKDYAFALNGTLTLALRGADGRVLARASNSGEPMSVGLPFRPSVSGTYYVDAAALVEDGFYDADYYLKLGTDCRADARTRCGLVLGKPRGQQTNWASDTDWFRVTLKSTERYNVHLAPRLNSQVYILDAAGAVLAQGDSTPTSTDVDIVGFKPARSGTYYVSVTGEDDDGGPYTVTIGPDAKLAAR